MLGQITFISTPDTLAEINQLFTYDVDATGIPDDPSYALDEAPAGMLINSTTGVITWTPDHEADGGKVVVRATNTGNTKTQEFNVYVAGDPICISRMVSYWK